MTETTIWHNPRCSKSRATLELLRENGVEPKIVYYLEQTPSADELRDTLTKLGKSPWDLLRRGEAKYRQNGLDDETVSDERVIHAMVEHPILIERPVVIRGDRAVVGRPPENVLDLLDRG